MLFQMWANGPGVFSLANVQENEYGEDKDLVTVKTRSKINSDVQCRNDGFEKHGNVCLRTD